MSTRTCSVWIASINWVPTLRLSMEEVDGITLSQAVKQLKELDPDLAYSNLLKLLRDFASGLAMMHAHGYIHRDVKPDNLMVDHNGNGRVIDYGLVDSFELDRESFSARGFLLGTPHYFSPEVIWSQRYLPASDIFSLGIVILDALRKLQRSAGKERSGVSNAPIRVGVTMRREFRRRLRNFLIRCRASFAKPVARCWIAIRQSVQPRWAWHGVA